MTMFWLVAALFAAGALLILLPPLWSPPAAGVGSAEANLALHRAQWHEAERDVAEGLLAPEGLAPARAEIERRVLDDVPAAAAARSDGRPARRTAIVVALLLPAAAALLYARLGLPQATDPPAMPQERHATGPAQLAALAGALLARVEAEPAQAEAWVMLGRAYTMLGRYRDGALALERAVELVPANPHLLADLADVSAMAQGRRFAGAPARRIQQALDADARHPKALALAGSAAYEAQDWAAARGYWERALAVLPPDGREAAAMRANVAEARRLESPGGTMAFSGEVVLDPALAARLPPNATLFVFVRAVEGPRQPLAALRAPAGAWPFVFTLDERHALAPGRPLAPAGRVVVGARLSAGSATPASGDLVGESAPVDPAGGGSLRIVIDRVQP